MRYKLKLLGETSKAICFKKKKVGCGEGAALASVCPADSYLLPLCLDLGSNGEGRATILSQ